MGLFDGTPLERPVRCEECDKLIDACDCPPPAEPSAAPSDFDLRVRRERRRGKWSTVIAGLDADPGEQKSLLKQLRTHLGAGGGVTDGELILQGDHRDAVVSQLVAMGYRAKPAGG